MATKEELRRFFTPERRKEIQRIDAELAAKRKPRKPKPRLQVPDAWRHDAEDRTPDELLERIRQIREEKNLRRS